MLDSGSPMERQAAVGVRKRFSADERKLIDSGVPLQVQNVTQWHDVRVTDRAVVRDAYGWESVAGTIERTRGTVRAGDPFPVTPGHVRARSERDRDIMRTRTGR
jgi:hypothetical protein